MLRNRLEGKLPYCTLDMHPFFTVRKGVVQDSTQEEWVSGNSLQKTTENTRQAVSYI